MEKPRQTNEQDATQLSCSHSSLLVSHPCRHDMGTGVGSVSDLVNQFGYFDQIDGKVWII